MAFHLIHADSHALLASDTPLIRAADRPVLHDATALLAEVAALRQRQDAMLAAARADAETAGRLSGEQSGRAAFAEAITALIEQADTDRARREEEIATLALAALRQMIGALGQTEVMGGIARRAVEVVGAKGPLVVEVSPAMADPVAEALTALPTHITADVRADETLADDQCRLTGPDGRVIADLGVQLAAFADRWDVAHAG